MRGSGRLRLLLVLLVLTAFTLTALDVRRGEGGPLDALRSGADAVLGPAQRTVSGAVDGLADLLGLGDSDEVAELTRRAEELERLLAASEGDRRRAMELDCLLRTKDLARYTGVLAKVTASGAATPFEQTVVIDAGSDDPGVAVGRTVISSRGLVGRIVRVGRYTSTVALLTDRTFTVGATLSRVGSLGFVSGTGRGPLRLELARLDDDSQLKVGDALVTSGSETFVPGVPIGRISVVSSRSGQLVRTASVEPFVDVTALDLLMVVTEGPRTQPRVVLAPSPRPGSPAAQCTVRPSPTPSATPTASGQPAVSGTPRPAASPRVSAGERTPAPRSASPRTTASPGPSSPAPRRTPTGEPTAGASP